MTAPRMLPCLANCWTRNPASMQEVRNNTRFLRTTFMSDVFFHPPRNPAPQIAGCLVCGHTVGQNQRRADYLLSVPLRLFEKGNGSLAIILL